MDKKIPHSRKPDEMSIDEWQSKLRRQFAAEQRFKIRNIGPHPVFSDFEVYNPVSGKTYKVSIRDNIRSYNYCSCPDFTINALGTCKHIEFVLSRFLKYKKYRKFLERPYEPGYSSLSIFYGKERKIRLKKGDHTGLLYREQEYFDDEGFLRPGMLGTLDHFIQNTPAGDHEFRVYPDVYEFIEQHKKEEERKRIARELFPDGKESQVFNHLINTKMYPYQKSGVQKIIETGRILLADEMGLGKTIQAIAATEILAKYFGVGKVLIICPTSLKFQWKREIEKFCGREAVIVEGLIHKRKELYAVGSFYKIISYGVCYNDLDFINGLNSELVIIDEAQRIKNWKTQIARAVKKVRSDFAFVLTGTPLENRIEELHSIVEYIDRYRLGPLFRFLDKHQVLDKTGKLKGYKNLRDINRTLDNVMLRRTRKEIIDQLPGRVDKNFFVEMTKEQMTDHESYNELVHKLVSKWIITGFLSEEEKQNLLILLNCMRMVCDSTYILDRQTDYGNKISELSDLLTNLLEDRENKIVIFSQWKRMFELVIKMLDTHNVRYVYLNGDIPAIQRNQIIEEFQNDPELRIFLSTDAGGVGVNLQSANVLINIDLPWNPAVLEQRIGRIYRLGQKKHVNVFNFISKGSIEHRILYLLDFKKSVFNGAIDEDGKDEVMIEGFLESVRDLMEINVDDANTGTAVVNISHNPQTVEIYKIHNPPEVSDTNSSPYKNKPVEREVNNFEESGIRKTPGFFIRIKRTVEKFLKYFRISG